MGVLLCGILEKLTNHKVSNVFKILIIIELLFSVKLIGSNVVSDLSGFFALAILPEVYILCYDSVMLNKICDNKIFAFWGDISYDLYLWNFPILLLMHIMVSKGLIDTNFIAKPSFVVIAVVIHMSVATISGCIRRFLKYILGVYTLPIFVEIR